jgi:hypothetical protein
VVNASMRNVPANLTKDWAITDARKRTPGSVVLQEVRFRQGDAAYFCVSLSRLNMTRVGRPTLKATRWAVSKDKDNEFERTAIGAFASPADR